MRNRACCGEDELRHLIAVVWAQPLIAFYAVKERERMSGSP